MDDERKQRLQKITTALSQSRYQGGGFNVQVRGQMQAPDQPEPDQGSFFGNFFRSAGRAAIEGAKLPVTISKEIGSNIWDAMNSTAESIVQGVSGFSEEGSFAQRELRAIQEREQNATRLKNMVIQRYKSGELTKSQYQEQLRDVGEQFEQIGNSARVISEESSVKQRIFDAVETATLPLAGGSLRLGGGLKFIASGSKIARTFGKSVTGLEAALARVPVMKEILTRSTPMGSKLIDKITFSKLAGTALDEPVKNAIVGFYIRQPLLVGQNISEANSLIEDLADGENLDAVGRAAWISSQLLQGGPLGASFTALKKLGGGTRSLIFGSDSMYDNIARELKGGDAAAITKYLKNLKETDPQKYDEVKEALEVMQEVGLRKAGDDAKMAAQFQIDWHTKQGVILSDLTAEEYVDRTLGLYQARQTAFDAAKRGMLELPNGDPVPRHLSSKVAVGRFDRKTKSSLKKLVEDANAQGGNKAVIRLMDKLEEEGVSYMQNPNVRDTLKRLAKEGDPEALITKIDGLTPSTPLKWAGGKNPLKDGYFPILLQPSATEEFVQPREARRLISAFAEEGTDIDIARKPVPVAKTIGAAMRRVGLTPEDTSSANYYQLKRNLQQNLEDIGGERLGLPIGADDGGAIIGQLQRYADSKRQIFDLRQLRVLEIAEQLGIKRTQAKLIRNAINQAYLQVPLQIRGLGDRIVDYAYASNPLFKQYSRAQSAGRYAYNPFFKWQEVTETEILSQSLAGGKRFQYPVLNQIRALWRKSSDEMDTLIQKLDDNGIFTTGFSGEAAQDAVLGRLTANLTRGQKESLAGLAEAMAKKAGKDLDTYLAENINEVTDALRVVVQYPKRSALNSSLARTINLAFFPTRYNLKVATLAAKQLSKQPAIIQFATLNSIYDFENWLQSEEGVAWSQDHAEALGVFQWLTPIGSVKSVMDVLGGNVDSVSELGLLGGLPFGLISQALDSQGVVQLGTPYVDPKTGEVFPDWVPETTRARAQVAITDLLMSMFTYPGAVIGLPGKGKLTREFVDKVSPTTPDDFDIVEREDLTPEQKKQIEALQKLNGTHNTLPNAFDGYKLPPGPLPETVDRLEETELREEPQETSGGGGGETVARPIRRR